MHTNTATMLFSLLFPAAASLAAASVAVAETTNLAPSFDWFAIVPSEQLKYQNCYNGFKCARLVAPLDWKNPEDNKTVAIAMIKLPAVVPDNDPTFGGTIIFNPGGPGISGVDAALQGARTIQQNLADKPGVRHYEILSFDPRGVGRTTPASDCFRSDPLGRITWIVDDRANGPLVYLKPAQSYGLGLAKNFVEQCRLNEEFKGSMEYVNTPSVARDMVAMIDEIDELRQREAAQKQPKPPGDQRLPPGLQGEAERDEDEEAQESPKTQLHQRGKTENHEEDENNPVPRIQYIGFSYGTILGNTFASMFPGRVGRMVLDGVHSAKDYYFEDTSTALQDTDEMFDAFLRGCFDANYTKCPFRISYKDADDVKKKFWDWIFRLNYNPVEVNPVKGGIKVVRGSDVLAAVGSALYSPMEKFQPLALGLYDGMSIGDLNRLAAIIDEDSPKITIDASSNPLQPKSEQTWGVTCSDGPDWRGRDVGFWNKHLQKLEMKSRLFGPFWASVRSACASWPYRPNWVFGGPFKTPTPSSEPLYTSKPAAPILFLSSRYDPIAPLHVARAMAKEHPDSGVLIHWSMGHTTVGGGPSPCAWNAVREYLYDGKILGKEFSCPAECDPWDDVCRVTLHKRADGKGDSWDVWKNMTVALRQTLRPRPWGIGAP